MSYEAVLEQIRAVPAEYLDEISGIIRYVIYRHETEGKPVETGSLAQFFGTLDIEGDPLEIQKEMRNEWD